MGSPKKRAPGRSHADSLRDLRDRVTDGLRAAVAMQEAPRGRWSGELAGLSVIVSGRAVVVGHTAFSEREVLDACTLVRAGGWSMRKVAREFRCSVEHVRALLLLDEMRRGKAA